MLDALRAHEGRWWPARGRRPGVPVWGVPYDAAAHPFAAQAVVDAAAPGRSFDLVWQSRSGPPSVQWLEPDVNDHLRGLSDREVPGVVVVPIGFVSDHMEVIYDLDTEAVETARELGLPLARAATVGTHPAFVGALVDLVLERAAAARGEEPERPVVEGGAVGWYDCQPDCCLNARTPDRPALCQVGVAQPAPAVAGSGSRAGAAGEGA